MEMLDSMATNYLGLDATSTFMFCTMSMFMHLLHVQYPTQAPSTFTHNGITMAVPASIRKSSAEMIKMLLTVMLRSEFAARKALFDDFGTEDDRACLRSYAEQIGPPCPAKSCS